MGANLVKERFFRDTLYFFFSLSDLFCGAEVKSPFFPPLGGELAAASEDDSEHGIRPALPYFRHQLSNRQCGFDIISVLTFKQNQENLSPISKLFI